MFKCESGFENSQYIITIFQHLHLEKVQLGGKLSGLTLGDNQHYHFTRHHVQKIMAPPFRKPFYSNRKRNKCIFSGGKCKMFMCLTIICGKLLNIEVNITNHLHQIRFRGKVVVTAQDCCELRLCHSERHTRSFL
jgi:hypothetical protein